MKQAINIWQFQDAFKAIRPDNFTYDGLAVLFDFFEEYEESTSEEIELDVIAICCEYNEDTPQEIADNYEVDISQCSNLIGSNEVRETVLEYLHDHTMVCGETSDTIVYMAF